MTDHLILYDVAKGTTSGNPYAQGLGSVDVELDPRNFDLRKVGQIINGGGNGKMYELQGLGEGIGTGRNFNARTTSSSTHAIKAYFLPWGSGMTFCGKLRNQADYFFTPTVNGCTFAYDGDAASPSVAHSNFVNNQIIGQAAINPKSPHLPPPAESAEPAKNAPGHRCVT